MLLILIFSQTRTPITQIIEYDPPSIYNLGPGGITKFFYSKALERKINIIHNLHDLKLYEPQSHVLMILSPDKDIEDIDFVFSWIREGGVAIIGDELNHSINIFKAFGVEYYGDVAGINIAKCVINNKTIDIVINVAKALISSNMDAETICFYGSMPIAYNISYGAGYIVLLGDSSIVINEISSYPLLAKNNTMFIDIVIGDRNLIIYEGSRIYTVLEAQIISQIINAFLNGLTTILAWITIGRGVIGIVEFSIGIIAMVMFYTLVVFGLQSNPRKYLGVYTQTSKKLVKDLKESILLGVKKWMEI
uniref:DUF4350 domain-containing protein n=1 Tax=Ignisphaera aggregans TaxID=334771 RepID=A0A7C5XHB1_9CREN